MHRLRIGGVRPASIDPQIAAVHPAQFLQLLDERSALRPSIRIALRPAHQYADPAHPLRLLRTRYQWPRGRAAKCRDEGAPPHSITSSARAINPGETVSPIAFATFRLIASSYFVGICTGNSAGLSPFKTRSR